MNIVLFGPPGSGKGTQAEKLANEYKLLKVSTGDLLRKEINKKSKLGEEINSKISKGFLVSDDILDNLIENIFIKEGPHEGLIFDGYPRTLSQLKILENLIKKYEKKISFVFSLNVDQNTIIKRILGRELCSKCGLIFNKFFYPSNKKNHNCDPKFLNKRNDDNEETILKRIQTYKKETLPILNYYKNQSLLHEIDGIGDITHIYKQIQSIINTLEAWLYNVYLYK